MNGSEIKALKRLLRYRVPHTVITGNTKPAGVLLPLDQRPSGPHLLFTRRSKSVSQHQGEVSFPGGSREESDPDMLTCALRESEEELGIRPKDVAVLGALDPVVTRTGFLVSPFVGTLPYPYPITASEREVAEVLEVPLSWLLDPRSLRYETRLTADGTVDHRYFYTFGAHLIYGATATMLTQLLDLLREVPNPHRPAQVSI